MWLKISFHSKRDPKEIFKHELKKRKFTGAKLRKKLDLHVAEER